MTNTTLTTRPGASPESTTRHECGPARATGECERQESGAPPHPGRARGRRISLSVSMAWALSVVMTGAIGAAYLLGRAAGIVDGYWQCAGELGVVG